MYYIGIDLGGTNIAAGVCDENFKIVGRGAAKTNLPRSAEAVAADMVSAAKAAVQNAGLTIKDIRWAGIGAPGSIEPESGTIIYNNNLGFNNVPIVDLVEKGLGVKTYVENDGNAAAYGEMLAGAGRGVKDLIAITLGTGVGGGIIIDEKIYAGFNYAGAELGHMVIEKDGWPCTCGRKGCFESYSSATGMIKMTKLGMQKHPGSVMWKLVGGNLDNAGGKTACDGVRKGDEAAREVWDKYLDYLACGIVNLINIFQPEVFCIGGGISKEGAFLLEPLRARISKETYSRSGIPQTGIVAAVLGNDAGIIGAAFLGNIRSGHPE